MPSVHDAYFAEVEERFAEGTDFTIGIEEEFQILDPATFALTDGFETLRDSAPPELEGRVLGELLRSEIEVATWRCPDFPAAVLDLSGRRAGLFPHAQAHGYALGSSGTHPFSSWKDQQIIDTPHYRLVEEGLKYVAWRNNTWSFHVHVGVRGADRAIKVCDALREHLPTLLTVSANSPFVEGMWTQLHSARVQTFTRMFPRCGVPEVFGDWGEHRRFIELLLDTNCIHDFTQVWWSVRPHHRYGTVEIRICDAQNELWQSLAIAALIVGLVATLAWQLDDGRELPLLPGRCIEENLWRAIRYGLDGKQVDFSRRAEEPAADAVRRLVEFAGPAADALGLHPWIDDVERLLRAGGGAQRQSRAHQAGAPIERVFAAEVAAAADEARTLRGATTNE